MQIKSRFPKVTIRCSLIADVASPDDNVFLGAEVCKKNCFFFQSAVHRRSTHIPAKRERVAMRDYFGSFASMKTSLIEILTISHYLRHAPRNFTLRGMLGNPITT